ncbi:unnamed protein product, partial [Ilex paraguariensis]
QQFLDASRTGNLDLFKKLATQLDEGRGLAQTVADVKDANKRGALHFAAREGKTEVCKYLLEDLKLDVIQKTKMDMDASFSLLLVMFWNLHCLTGETPLIHAARQGHTSTAKYLIECGADPEIPSELGATALHHAAGIGDIELLRFLLSHDVDVNSQSDAGTALIWAAGHGQQDAVKVLLEHHANKLPLEWLKLNTDGAAKGCSCPTACGLYSALSPNAETDDNITPLLSAVAAGSLACLEQLIQEKKNLGILAPTHNSLGCLHFLAGADVNVIAGGATPLHIAADNGSIDIINCILKAGGDPNVTDEVRL